MATSLSELRKSRSSMLDKIVKNLDSGGARKEKDDRFWSLTRDKAGNGSALIRILPPMGEDELPWVKSFGYGFQGPTGKWYINESPTAIGLPDPVAELNSAAYASKDESLIEEAKKRRRRNQFIANIQVIKDPSNPDNEGKVFLWKFGKKILDMIMAKAKPEFADETPLEVWDIDEGANLKLRIKNVAGYPNYDSSEWTSSTPLAKSDEAMEEILDKTHRLNEFIKPEHFKSYDDLKKELDRALNSTGGPAKTAADKIAKELSDDAPFDLDAEVKKAAPAARKVEPKATVVDDEDDSLDEFKALLEGL